MRFWIWLGRVRTPLDVATKLSLFVGLAACVNHLRALVADWPHHHGFITSFWDAAFVAVPLGGIGLVLLARLGRLQDELEWHASMDTLTNLPNRRVTLDRLDADLAAGQAGSLLMADIDFFKRINDTYGHAGGDVCLQKVADLLRATCGPKDYVARLGGEEFALFMPDGTPEDVAARGQVLARGIAINLSGVAERVTMSVGIAASPPAQGLQDLMQRADEALYFAKAQGRACAVDWDIAELKSGVFANSTRSENLSAVR